MTFENGMKRIFNSGDVKIASSSPSAAPPTPLKKGEKTKFDMQEVETDLFGKPKTFEVAAVSDR